MIWHTLPLTYYVIYAAEKISFYFFFFFRSKDSSASWVEVTKFSPVSFGLVGWISVP